MVGVSLSLLGASTDVSVSTAESSVSDEITDETGVSTVESAVLDEDAGRTELSDEESRVSAEGVEDTVVSADVTEDTVVSTDGAEDTVVLDDASRTLSSEDEIDVELVSLVFSPLSHEHSSPNSKMRERATIKMFFIII